MIVNNITYQSLPNINYDKLSQDNEPVPREVLEYYISHGYVEKMIPLNAKTANEILEKLKSENCDDDNAKYYPKEPKKNVLKELQESGQLHLAEDNSGKTGGDNSC